MWSAVLYPMAMASLALIAVRTLEQETTHRQIMMLSATGGRPPLEPPPPPPARFPADASGGKWTFGRAGKAALGDLAGGRGASFDGGDVKRVFSACGSGQDRPLCAVTRGGDFGVVEAHPDALWRPHCGAVGAVGGDLIQSGPVSLAPYAGCRQAEA